MSERVERLCIWCRHFRFDVGWEATDTTPSKEWTMSCAAGPILGETPFKEEGIAEFYEIIGEAKNCAAYEFAPAVRQSIPDEDES